MRARRVIAGLALLLWVAMTSMTVYVLVSTGPDVLVFLSVLVCVLLGAAVLGLLREST
jgi:hypothetical protein